MQVRWLGSEAPEAPSGPAWRWGSGSRAPTCSVRLRSPAGRWFAPDPITAGVACLCPDWAGVGALTPRGLMGICGGPASAPGGRSSVWWRPECPGPQFPRLQPAPVVLPGVPRTPEEGSLPDVCSLCGPSCCPRPATVAQVMGVGWILLEILTLEFALFSLGLGGLWAPTGALLRKRFWSLCQWTQAPTKLAPPAVFPSGSLAREARWAGD